MRSSSESPWGALIEAAPLLVERLKRAGCRRVRLVVDGEVVYWGLLVPEEALLEAHGRLPGMPQGQIPSGTAGPYARGQIPSGTTPPGPYPQGQVPHRDGLRPHTPWTLKDWLLDTLRPFEAGWPQARRVELLGVWGGHTERLARVFPRTTAPSPSGEALEGKGVLPSEELG